MDKGVDEAGSVEAATYESGALSFLAVAHGTLEVEKGCLVLGGEGGRELIVFRAQDIVWDGRTLTHEGRQHRLGEVVDLGGGVFVLSELRGLHLPEGWRGTERAFVVAPSGPDPA